MGDSILDIIGDLERVVISGVEKDDRRDGNISIVKLKELVRVLCGELTISEYSDNCSNSSSNEDIPRRRTSSAMIPDLVIAKTHLDVVESSASEVVASIDVSLPPAPPDVEAAAAPTPNITNRSQRVSSVSEVLSTPDSDDDATASPRATRKNVALVRPVREEFRPL